VKNCEYDTVITKVNNLFSKKNTLRHLRHLVEDIGPRASGSEGDRRAKDYIAESLRSYGLSVALEAFEFALPEVEKTEPPTDIETFNVIGLVNVNEQKHGEIALGAHYDTYWKVPNCPGATDNAAGVAALLEAARITNQLVGDFTLRRNIKYIAFGAEEHGQLGSYYHVTGKKDFGKLLEASRTDDTNQKAELYQQIAKEAKPVEGISERYYINMDSIGNTGKFLCLFIGDVKELEGIKSVICKVLGEREHSFFEHERANPLEYGSDHVWYNLIYGVPALCFLWPVKSKNDYHSSMDTLDKVNLESLEISAKILAVLAIMLAKGKVQREWKKRVTERHKGASYLFLDNKQLIGDESGGG